MVESSSKIEVLADHAKELSSLSNEEMLKLAQNMLSNLYQRDQEWSTAGNWTVEWSRVDELRIDKNSSYNSEARVSASMVRFVTGSTIGKMLQTYCERYEYQISQNATTPKLLANSRTVEDYKVYGRVSAGLPGHSFELWTRPNANDADNTTTKANDDNDKICLVLGSCNQPFLSATDILDSIFLRRMPVLFKHHPLRPFLLEPYSILMEPLKARGFWDQVLDSGIPETKELVSHPKVGHVHLTGSLTTDKAVRDTLREAHPDTLSESDIRQMVTSELGAVTPCILMPGTYTETELVHAARLIAFAKKTNGGCNCLAANAVIMAKDWEQKDEFRRYLVEELKRSPDIPAYYPGSRERKKKLQEPYEKERARLVESSCTDGKPEDAVVLLECGTPGTADYENSALLQEAFGPVLALVELPGGKHSDDTPEDYITKVVAPFVNDKENIYGSLSCLLLLPGNLSDTSKLDSMVSSLHYGTVAINCPSLIGYISMTQGAVWGAHIRDHSWQSGHGYVGNAYGLPAVDKTVCYGTPLSSNQAFDGASPPPAVILDALHAATCAPSYFSSTVRVCQMLNVRLMAKLLSPFASESFVNKMKLKYGKAMVPSE